MPMKIDYSYNYRIVVVLCGEGSEIELINEWILYNICVNKIIIIKNI